MPEITGSLTSIAPTNAQVFPAASTVDATAAGSVTLPAAEGGVQEEYRVVVTISIYNEETCLTEDGAAIASYTEVFEERSYTTSDASRSVSGDGGYLLTATLTAEKKKGDGSYEPKATLDTRSISFRIGNAGCSPQVHICTAGDADGSSSSTSSSANGCTAPSPAPGSVVSPGTVSVACKVKYAIVGNASCTREYKFVGKLEMSGPSSGASELPALAGPGLTNGIMILQGNHVLTPGEYTASVAVTAQRTDSSVPACSQVKSMGSYSWNWTVRNPSSSSSSSPSSSSSSSPSSSSSSSPSSSSSSSPSSSSSTFQGAGSSSASVTG